MRLRVCGGGGLIGYVSELGASASDGVDACPVALCCGAALERDNERFPL